MLKINNVSFAYTPGKPVVNKVSLQVAAGEFIAIAGRNGSGKTTLTRLLMTLIKPTSGEITIDGAAANKFTPADMARNIGYVFQNPDRQLFQDTVAAEVAYGPEQLGFPPDKLAAAVQNALDVTGLSDLAQAYPRLLSKGQKQKVAIASALAMQPRLLILDEPTSGQDAAERDNLLQLLAKLNGQGMAIVIVTHDMELLTRYAKRVVVMAQGQIVYDGGVTELFDETDVEKWGLRRPTAVKLSQALTEYGVKPTTALPDLYHDLSKLLRGGEHA